MGEVSDKCGSHCLECRRAVFQLYFLNISYALQSVKGLNFKQLISESRNFKKKCVALEEQPRILPLWSQDSSVSIVTTGLFKTFKLTLRSANYPTE